MSVIRTVLLAATAAIFLADRPALAECRPAAEVRATLQALKADKWRVADAARRQDLALRAMQCLADPDPLLRDELSFEALSTWMRANQVKPETAQTIRLTLQGWLRQRADAAGFRQPFAALTLAEVARMNRLTPFLSVTERNDLIDAGTAYLGNVRDYRGFHDQEGWRHGVAHGADLMLQLALDPTLDRPQLDRILTAVASQVAPSGEHFYQYREGERLMAPVFFAGRRGLHRQADWSAWFAALVVPLRPSGATTQASLARRHNLAGFLLPLYFSLQESTDGDLRERMLPAVRTALREID